MKSRFLFSHKFKALGWVLFLLGFIFGMVLWISDYDFEEKFQVTVFAVINESFFLDQGNHLQFITNGIVDELISILIIIGGILVIFSKAKVEDEFISRIRMESLIWATYVNYTVLLVSIIFVYGLAFFDVLVYNMFTMLVFFILRFHYVLNKSKKNMSNEE